MLSDKLPMVAQNTDYDNLLEDGRKSVGLSIVNYQLRKSINKKNRERLQNRNFSLICSNCNGAFILHDLGVRFNSPFVNLWFEPKDFIKYLQNIEYYSNCEIDFIRLENIAYPVGVLDDIKIYFQYYASEEEAKQKWMERTKRIDYNNLFVLFTDRDGCSYQDLCDFDALPYINKVVFVHKPYPELKSAYFLKGWEEEDRVGMCFAFKNKLSGKRYYDDFDYVGWFNANF